MTNREAIEKFKKIKRGNIFLIHQRTEGKEVIEDFSLCDMAISALQAQDAPDIRGDRVTTKVIISKDGQEYIGRTNNEPNNESYL